MFRRKASQLARIEQTLGRIEAALLKVGHDADPASRDGLAAGLNAKIGSLDSGMADLAEVIRQVMAQRAEHDAVVAADTKRAAAAAESAFVATQAIASVMTAKPGDGPAPSPPPLPAETPKPAGPGKADVTS